MGSQGAIIGNNFIDDAIFGNSNGRDGCFQVYKDLADGFRFYGIDLHTVDQITDTPLFELHLDVQKPVFPNSSKYLLLSEIPLVYTRNLKIPDFYSKVFTWNDCIVDDKRCFKINLPNPMLSECRGDEVRDLRFSMIASNKSANWRFSNSLYQERQDLILWFEDHHPNEFSLFGHDWDKTFAKPGLFNRLIRKIERRYDLSLLRRPLSVYKGSVASKRDVLLRSEFTFAYENGFGYPGYVTEKCIDALLYGAIPIYWGASNVENIIPRQCFIDRRAFSCTNDLYDFINGLSCVDRYDYRKAGKDWMAVEGKKQFGIEQFVRQITHHVISDLG